MAHMAVDPENGVTDARRYWLISVEVLALGLMGSGTIASRRVVLDRADNL